MARAPAALPQGGVRGDGVLIFITLGTHEQPFERALDLVAPLAAGEDVVVQHGHTPARPESAGIRWLEFVGYDELVELMRNASAVVCHAGIGTIMTALGLGARPVVIPRLRRFGEHVDDHQLQITSEFARRGFVVPCLPGDDLGAALAAARTGSRQPQRSDGALKRAVGRATREARERH